MSAEDLTQFTGDSSHDAEAADDGGLLVERFPDGNLCILPVGTIITHSIYVVKIESDGTVFGTQGGPLFPGQDFFHGEFGGPFLSVDAWPEAEVPSRLVIPNSQDRMMITRGLQNLPYNARALGWCRP